ncbi:hypothetical protein IW492_01450 [Enterococcus sp. BWB1-3]|uniref:hypothetical protein n=1 Tax=unclassified Enterococcus TaxID=2608891 RepID=UPI001922EFE6|nr:MULTISPECIES: hypothetical protein [unclassified Enterococcus]MBL1227896.1 hypothetical protein [Enterococcus sp. BWB1-3]MCB5953104.1 hypothetical protein [Enterococcus sp. BWT-B8]MCB5956132.1 hypothetical protein [Enterococcus sp. CWB-B31]
MIAISSAMQQDAIKELLEGYSEGDFTYTFKEKQGIKLIFEVTGDSEEAAAKAKQLIKGESWGNVLYFQSAAV